MISIKRKVSFLIALIMILLGIPVETFAIKFGGIETIGPCEIPDNFDFQASDICTGHDNFLQASVTKSGRFALYTKYTDIKENPDLVYKLAFVDIYNEEGVFQQELSFNTEQDLAIELTEETLNIYFYDSVFSYDFSSKVLSGYSIPPEAAINNGLYASLRKSEFDCGGWHYTCKKALHGYTSFFRENQQQREVLVSFSGTGITLWNTAIPALSIGIAGFVVCFIISRKRKANRA